MMSRWWWRGAAATATSALVLCAPDRALAQTSSQNSVDIRTDAAVVAGSLGLALSVGSIIYGAKVASDLIAIRNGERSPFDGPYVRRNAQVGTFTCGGLLLLLGGAAIGLEASVGGACAPGSRCQIAYGFGGATLAAGAGMMVEGIVITTAPQQVRLRIPFLSQVFAPPAVVPFVTGSTWGVGLAGALL